MRTDPTKDQMRVAAVEHLSEISQVARDGHAKLGPGFVWLQFMFKGEWLMRIEYMSMAGVRKLGMRKDTMEQIKSVAARCDPLTQIPVLTFKGDKLESMGILPFEEVNGSAHALDKG